MSQILKLLNINFRHALIYSIIQRKVPSLKFSFKAPKGRSLTIESPVVNGYAVANGLSVKSSTETVHVFDIVVTFSVGMERTLSGLSGLIVKGIHFRLSP